MRTIKAEELNREAFNAFGTYADLMAPEGFNLGGFYPDRLIAPNGSGMPVAFSPLLVENYEGQVVSKAEHHNLTGEVILPLDDDVFIHVAPASQEVVPEMTRVFRVPQGTIVYLHTGVWHLGPMAVNKKTAHVMIGLPQRTYKSDCYVLDFPEDQFFTVEK